MKYIKPRLDFINEAKANPVYQEKVRKDKAEIRKLIPSAIKIVPLIKKYFLTEEYNDFCYKYLIPITEITNTKISIRYDHDNDGNGAFGAFDVISNTSDKHEYAKNIFGMARFLSDLNNHEYSIKTPEEDKGYPVKTGVRVTDYLDCSPFFYFNVYVNKHYCKCDLEYTFNYFGYKKIEIKHCIDKVIKDITKEDVTKIIIQCLEESYYKINSFATEHFKTLYDWIIKEDLIPYIKDIIVKSNYDMKLVGMLKHYPNILDKLNLDKDKVNIASEMGDLGF